MTLVHKVEAGFHWADYLVFSLTLAMSLGIGIFFAFRQKSTGEYFAGNRQLNFGAVAVSMFMSYISAILVLGTPAEMYTFGTQMTLDVVASTFAYLFAAFFLCPLFFPLKVVSACQYLKMRFQSYEVVVVAVFMQIINQVAYMGIAMYAPATALQATTGFPLWASILCIGLVGTIYTSIGGMKTVVWTDTLQGVIVFAGLITVIVIGATKLGGLTYVWNTAYEGGRINFFNMDPNPLQRMTFYSIVFANFFNALGRVGTNQTTIQRYCALPTQTKAMVANMLCIPMFAFVYFLTMMCGLVVYAHYATVQCDPLRAGFITSSNQLVPYYMIDQLNYPGLPGLFVAVLFSGALSSISSSLNSLSAVTWTDVLERKYSYLPEITKTFIIKSLAFGYGILAIGFSVIVHFMSGNVMQIANKILGSIGGPVCGMYLLASVFPCCNAIGAIVGNFAGLGLSVWFSVGSEIEGPHREVLATSITNCSFANGTEPKPVPTNPPSVFPMYSLSFHLYPLIACLGTILVGLVVSMATKPMAASEVHQTLLIQWFDMCCCIKKSTRKRLRMGAEWDIKDNNAQEESKKEDDYIMAYDSPNGDVLQNDKIIYTGQKLDGLKQTNDGLFLRHASTIYNEESNTTYM